MTRLSFQRGTEIEQKSKVLTWRLPKQQVTHNPPVPERENLKKRGPVFGRRAMPPVD